MPLDRVLIELHGQPTGIAILEGRQCRFYAVTPTFEALDGMLFPSAGAAEEACRKLTPPTGRVPPSH